MTKDKIKKKILRHTMLKWILSILLILFSFIFTLAAFIDNSIIFKYLNIYLAVMIPVCYFFSLKNHWSKKLL